MFCKVIPSKNAIHVVTASADHRLKIHTVSKQLDDLYLPLIDSLAKGDAINLATLSLYSRVNPRSSPYHQISQHVGLPMVGDYHEAASFDSNRNIRVLSFAGSREPMEWNFYFHGLINSGAGTVAGQRAELIGEVNKMADGLVDMLAQTPPDEMLNLPALAGMYNARNTIRAVGETVIACSGLRQRRPSFSSEKRWDWVNKLSAPRPPAGCGHYEPPLATAEEMISVELSKRFTHATAGIIPINLFKAMGDGFILGADGGLYITTGSSSLLDAISRQALAWETFPKRIAAADNTPWFDLPRVLQALADNPEGVYSPYRVVDPDRLSHPDRTPARIIIDKATELQAFDEILHPSRGDQVPAVPSDLVRWFNEDVMINYELVDLSHGTPMTLAKWNYIQSDLGVNHRLTREAALEVYEWLQHCTVASKSIVERSVIMERYQVYTGIEGYRQLDVSLADWWHRAQPGLRDGVAPGDLLPSMVQRIINAEVHDPMVQFLNVHTDDLFIRLKEMYALARWPTDAIDNVAALVEAVHPDERRGVILAGIQKMHANAKKFY